MGFPKTWGWAAILLDVITGASHSLVYLSLFEGLFLKEYLCSQLYFSAFCFSVALPLKELTWEWATKPGDWWENGPWRLGRAVIHYRGWAEYALAAGSVSWEHNFRGPWQSNLWLITPAPLLVGSGLLEHLRGVGSAASRLSQCHGRAALLRHSLAPSSPVLLTSMEGLLLWEPSALPGPAACHQPRTLQESQTSCWAHGQPWLLTCPSTNSAVL